MTDEQIILKGKEVIKIEAEAVKNLDGSINENFVKAARMIFEASGRVVFTGMGKSGLIARKIVATLNSTGTPAVYLHPTDALHGDLGVVKKGDIVVIVSKSGNTEELFDLIIMLKRMGIKIIGMLAAPESKLGSRCDVILDVYVKEEACPHDLAPTSSTTAALAMGDALSIALLEMRGFTPEDFAMLHPGGSLGKRLLLKISEIMYRGMDIPIVKETTSLKDSILEITSKRLGTTCVVDGNGTLTGIITDGDLRRLLEKSLNFNELTAGDVMTKNPKTIKADHLASYAIQVMEKYKITSLIVIDDKNMPAGLVHLHDLVKLGLQHK